MKLFDEINNLYYNKEQIKRIRAAKVGIAGAGGLGSNCAMALVRAGFVNLTIVDFDVITSKNLNRQFYFANQIGKLKTDAVRENLLAINDKLNLTTVCEKVCEENLEKLFGNCDVVVEAFDIPEFKADIARKYINSDKFFICVSGIAGFGNSDRIITRKIGKKSWIIGDGRSDIENLPPLAPAVLICAAKQADKVLEVVLNQE